MTDETKNAAREALAELLHLWLDGAPRCPYMPETLCHNHGRARNLADATLASPALDAIVAERVAAALLGAREDIRDRYREFSRLHADEQYLSALNDAWGLVNNRIPRAALTERTAER